MEIAVAHFCCNFESHMEKLAEAAVVCGGMRIVPKCECVLNGRPARHFLRQRQLCWIDINDCGVRGAQFFAMIVGLCVDLLCQCETIAVGLCEANQFFKPGGACGFKVHACVKSVNGFMDWCVDRKFIAARMYAELEIFRQIIMFDGVSDGGDIGREFSFELCNIADVIHALVEAAVEL